LLKGKLVVCWVSRFIYIYSWVPSLLISIIIKSFTNNHRSIGYELPVLYILLSYPLSIPSIDTDSFSRRRKSILSQCLQIQLFLISHSSLERTITILFEYPLRSILFDLSSSIYPLRSILFDLSFILFFDINIMRAMNWANESPMMDTESPELGKREPWARHWYWETRALR